MLFLDLIAEQRIAEAEREGLLDDLPGAGVPLNLDDDRLIPEELRIAYRILKNAGYVPPEVTALRDLAELEALVGKAEGEVHTAALRKLELLRLRLESIAPARAALLLRDAHRDRLVERFTSNQLKTGE